jgi:hypothetical protein
MGVSLLVFSGKALAAVARSEGFLFSSRLSPNPAARNITGSDALLSRNGTGLSPAVPDNGPLGQSRAAFCVYWRALVTHVAERHRAPGGCLGFTMSPSRIQLAFNHVLTPLRRYRPIHMPEAIIDGSPLREFRLIQLIEMIF